MSVDGRPMRGAKIISQNPADFVRNAFELCPIHRRIEVFCERSGRNKKAAIRFAVFRLETQENINSICTNSNLTLTNVLILVGKSNLHLSCIICPVKHRLSLPWSAKNISRSAIFGYLRRMPCHGFPPFYLSLIIIASSAHIIPTIPLKPTSRVLIADPLLSSPLCQRLRSMHTKII